MSIFLLILEFVVTKFYITRWKNLKHNELPSKKIYTHTQIRSYLCVNLIRRENIQTQSIHKNISTSTILHTSIQAHKFVLPHYPCSLGTSTLLHVEPTATYVLVRIDNAVLVFCVFHSYDVTRAYSISFVPIRFYMEPVIFRRFSCMFVICMYECVSLCISRNNTYILSSFELDWT